MLDLLFLCHRIPYPPDKGDKIRAFHILERLSRSFRIHLGCFVDDEADHVHVPKLAARVSSLGCFSLKPNQARLRALSRLRPGRPLSVEYFHDSRLAQWIVTTAKAHPVSQIVVFSSAMAPYASLVPKVPRLLDMVDIDSEKFAAYGRSTKSLMRMIWAREARTLLAFERSAVNEFDHTIFVSLAEHERFLTLAPEAQGRTGWIGNGVNADYFAPHHKFDRPFNDPAPAIVFTGAMDYRPNIDAVEWFAKEVMPQLAQRKPVPIFYIVGTNPASSVYALTQQPNIQVTGRVPDTRPYLAHASLVVAPLQIGRGVQNKVLEALAMARPIIASPEAFSGIQAKAGRDLLVADGVKETVQLAHAVLDGQYPELGACGRQVIRSAYEWEQTLRPLDSLVGLASSEPVIAVNA
jgi:sugar transferase (PEP-CTERM/EpsH1 system associated)